MKIYRVIDNSKHVLTTTDELKALRLFEEIMAKHDVTWGWVETEEVE